ncbi:hypothetical protein HY994_05925 [Candidatus Micrarchaeota archaeon]|nr:hypothetical protein [Candidatus Micrarchaeota archaeon]
MPQELTMLREFANRPRPELEADAQQAGQYLGRGLSERKQTLIFHAIHEGGPDAAHAIQAYGERAIPPILMHGQGAAIKLAQISRAYLGSEYRPQRQEILRNALNLVRKYGAHALKFLPSATPTMMALAVEHDPSAMGLMRIHGEDAARTIQEHGKLAINAGFKNPEVFELTTKTREALSSKLAGNELDPRLFLRRVVQEEDHQKVVDAWKKGLTYYHEHRKDENLTRHAKDGLNASDFFNELAQAENFTKHLQRWREQIDADHALANKEREARLGEHERLQKVWQQMKTKTG